ncbi:hypothetical protein CsSME_00035790 [Camellia sinensis var. sinensis]
MSQISYEVYKSGVKNHPFEIKITTFDSISARVELAIAWAEQTRNPSLALVDLAREGNYRKLHATLLCALAEPTHHLGKLSRNLAQLITLLPFQGKTKLPKVKK